MFANFFKFSLRDSWSCLFWLSVNVGLPSIITWCTFPSNKFDKNPSFSIAFFISSNAFNLRNSFNLSNLIISSSFFWFAFWCLASIIVLFQSTDNFIGSLSFDILSFKNSNSIFCLNKLILFSINLLILYFSRSVRISSLVISE